MLKKIIHRIKKKITGGSGFSLAELLMATLIMMIATSVITRTIGVAGQLYNESIQKTEAQVLCSTLSNYLEGELTYAAFSYDKNTGALETNDHNAVIFSSDVHNMGNGSYFMIIDSSNNRHFVNSGSTVTGRVVETSEAYGGPAKYFDIAGESSYDISSRDKYDLYAALSIKPGVGSGGAADGYSVIAKISVKDQSGRVLAENSLRILPMSMEAK